ncbi:long chain base biosynthesis protein 2d [Iris pallida]|uniref:Long chain base biosynthesis protein 2d n=1 Tax=Iris pallida TaxID=29817 RepID=A0AAX6IG03_IRIPA|nr:long chain base biosynthesis protein 2d [Iris pallida]
MVVGNVHSECSSQPTIPSLRPHRSLQSFQRSIKLYSNFYSPDIIIASPLGLVNQQTSTALPVLSSP